MKVSIFTQHGAQNSAHIFNSISKGLIKLGHTILYNTYDADVFVIWSMLFYGRMKQNETVWEYASTNNIPVIVIEVSSIKRNLLWRIGINGFKLPSNLFYKNRAEFLDIKLNKWNNNGSSILICGQRPSSKNWKHGGIHEWLINTIEELRNYTDRPIIFRPHPREPYHHDLSRYDVTVQVPQKIPNTYDDYNLSISDVWIVVNSSSPAVQAVIHGIPVITDDLSLAYSMSTIVANVEQPCYHPREDWLNQLCHMEWFQHELEDPTILSNILTDVLR